VFPAAEVHKKAYSDLGPAPQSFTSTLIVESSDVKIMGFWNVAFCATAEAHPENLTVETQRHFGCRMTLAIRPFPGRNGRSSIPRNEFRSQNTEVVLSTVLTRDWRVAAWSLRGNTPGLHFWACASRNCGSGNFMGPGVAHIYITSGRYRIDPRTLCVGFREACHTAFVLRGVGHLIRHLAFDCCNIVRDRSLNMNRPVRTVFFENDELVLLVSAYFENFGQRESSP